MLKKITAFSLLFSLFFRIGHAYAYTEKESLQLAKLAYENEFYDLSLNYLSRFEKEYPESELKPYGLVLKGLDLRKLNKLTEAKEIFTAVLSGYPNSPYAAQASYLRGETNLSLAAFGKAEEDFRGALNSGLAEETAPAAFQGLLASQANQGKFFEALALLAEWEGKHPGQVESAENRKVLLNAAERSIAAALKEGDYAKVHAVARTILENFPAGASLDRISYYEANASYQEGSLDTARTEFLKLQNSPDPEIAGLASFRLADIAVSLKEYASAILYYRQAEEKSGDAEVRAAAKFQLGTLARKDQDYVKAADYFQKALGSSTQTALQEKSLFELAGTVFLAGDYQKAVSLYRDFRKRFPKSGSAPAAFLQEAFALYNLKRYPEARTAFQNFARAYPENNLTGQACYGLGLVFIALGDKAQAASVWEGFLSKQTVVSEHAQMVLLLSRFLIETDRQAEAVAYLKRLASAPDLNEDIRAEAFLLLGLSYLKGNKTGESLAAFDSGVSLNPGQDLKNSLLKNKADLLLTRGDYREALPVYQLLRQTLPERRGEILYGTALCLQKLDRGQEAVPVYLEALMNLPADSPLAKEARSALAQIKKKM
jgi:TolA-binding protein